MLQRFSELGFWIILTSFLTAHAAYFQQEVHYKIDITFNPQTQEYSGMEEITYTNNAPTELPVIWLHIYPNAFKEDDTPYARQQSNLRSSTFHFSDKEERSYLNLNSVMAGQDTLEWQYKENAIDEAQLFLAKPLPPGASIKITLQFDAKFPVIFSRSGHWQGKYFQGTQWYPKVVVYDAKGWHPDSYLDVGEFYGEFATYDVSITLPENFIIDATGTLQDNPQEEAFNNSVINDTKVLSAIPKKSARAKFLKEWQDTHNAKVDFSQLKTVRFIAENVHDFSWFTGPDYMIHQDTTKDGVLVKTLALPRNAYDWRLCNDYVKKTLWFYGERIGKYKYPKITLVDGSYSPSGGMEYPMITLISTDYASWHNLLEMVIAHEVGHNWFQAMLGVNERDNVFLDEGVNSFYEKEYMDYYHGFNSVTHFDSLLGQWNIFSDVGMWYYHAALYGMRISQGKDQTMNLRGEDYNRINYSIVNYSKGIFLLNALQWTIGEENFNNAIKSYFEHWHFRHPDIDIFWSIMEESSGQDLTSFRKEWMESTHYADFKIVKYKTLKEDDGYSSEVFISDNGTMKGLPAPVHLVTITNDTLEQRWSGKETEPVVFHHKNDVKHIEVNLKRQFFETNYLNNTKWPQIEFSFLDPVPALDTYKVSFYPYAGYEYFKDGTRLGGGFWAGNFLEKKYLLSANTYYGSRSGAIGYELAFTHRLPGFLINYSNVAIAIQDKDGLKNIHTYIQTHFNNPPAFSLHHTFQLGISHINLHDMQYHEKGIYEKARYTAGEFLFNSNYREMLWNNHIGVSLQKTLKTNNSQIRFTKFEISDQAKFKLSKYVELAMDLYLGQVSGDHIPQQELIFAGGNVDPKHEHFVPGYRGSVAPLRSFYLENGMGMPGYAHHNRNYFKNRAGFSTGLEIKLPYMPSLYGRAGTLSDEIARLSDKKFFYEAGLKLKTPLISFIMPVYVSDPFAGEDNFDFRFYFAIERLLNFD